MARTARFLKNGACYYICAQGCRNQPIFKEDGDYRHYVRLLRKYKRRFASLLYGYCLMPDSIHLIVHPRESYMLPAFMQGLHQSYALYFNARYRRTGKVWGQRYKSILLGADGDLVACVKSVEFLPVSDRAVQSPAHYPWSSCSHRILGQNSILDFMPPAQSVLSVSN